MTRSNLINEDVISAFDSLQKMWKLEPHDYSEFWDPLVDAEPELTTWLLQWIEAIGDRMPVFKEAFPDEPRFAEARHAMVEIFLAGMWFGERRWTLKDGDVFSDLRDQINQVGNEIENAGG